MSWGSASASLEALGEQHSPCRDAHTQVTRLGNADQVVTTVNGLPQASRAERSCTEVIALVLTDHRAGKDRFVGVITVLAAARLTIQVDVAAGSVGPPSSDPIYRPEGRRVAVFVETSGIADLRIARKSGSILVVAVVPAARDSRMAVPILIRARRNDAHVVPVVAGLGLTAVVHRGARWVALVAEPCAAHLLSIAEHTVIAVRRRSARVEPVGQIIDPTTTPHCANHTSSPDNPPHIRLSSV